MPAERMLRVIHPQVLTLAQLLHMKRIVDLVLRLRSLSTHEQTHVAIGVVDERVRDSCSRRKRNCITRIKSIKVSIHPHVRIALDHKSKFFFSTLRVRPGCSSSRRKKLVVNSNSRESKLFAKRRSNAVQLLTIRIVGVVGFLEGGVVGDVGWPSALH